MKSGYEEQRGSGTTSEDRPEVLQRLADIEAGYIGAVIARDWNRLPRDESI
jgi:DNA invertase Pin-like site-specific DNA recombinase